MSGSHKFLTAAKLTILLHLSDSTMTHAHSSRPTLGGSVQNHSDGWIAESHFWIGVCSMAREDAITTAISPEASGEDHESQTKPALPRRSFLKGVGVAGVALSAGSLLPAVLSAEQSGGSITKGDAAILRFLAAAEILETDLWQQYNEFAGIQDSEVPGGSGNELFTEAVAQLDEDMTQYIHDNTEDELTHEVFINAYLAAHGAPTVNLDAFRTLPSSKATGAQQIGRLTNLMQLTVDTTVVHPLPQPAARTPTSGTTSTTQFPPGGRPASSHSPDRR